MKAINGFYDFAGYRKDVRYFDCYGHMATGLIEMGGTTFYFDTQTGIQAKDKFIRFSDGRIRYFIPDTGNMAVNTFVQNKENQAWYYLDQLKQVKWLFLALSLKTTTGIMLMLLVASFKVQK